MFIGRLFLSLCVGLLLVAPCAVVARANEATRVVVIPKPVLSPMNFLLGSWSCSKQDSSRPAPYISMENYAVIPSGQWIEETAVWNPVPWLPIKWISHDEITYDSYRKRWVDVEYDDIGGYSITTSPGWAGNKMVWHDLAFNPSSRLPSVTDVTMMKVNDSKATWAWSRTSKSGKTIFEKNTCTKI